MKIRKSDIVTVISGDDKGKTGKVLRALRGENKLIVEGINLVWKHMRKSKDYPKGARIRKEAPISIANVMLVCQSCGKPAKVAMKFLESGEKVRICKKCKETISVAESPK
jgi:large subunit ribosomal protein L24